MTTHHVAFHPLIVTAATTHRAARLLLASPALRIVRADEVRPGDLIVSALTAATPGRLRRTDYFACSPYPADPGPYDPACGCGVCGLPEVEGPHDTVVLTRDSPGSAATRGQPTNPSSSTPDATFPLGRSRPPRGPE
ncbi:hypothetical protein [Kitasatospora sp. NPDC098663]|uniref:hypothetical protein n=1 Tax=Kitasatospora sp. NPDC098663 TaxID=3364096 RepID=UPI00380699C8